MVSAKDLGIQVMRASGDEEYCLCPFHADHSASASFNRVKGMFYCYVCDLGLNLVQLQERLGVALDLNQLDNEREPEDYDLLGDTPSFSLGEATYVGYFAERYILPSVIDRYGVRWQESPAAAVLPLTGLTGRVQGVAYRYLEGPTRYKVYGDPTPLWPMPLLNGITRTRPLLIVEGAWSAMRLAGVDRDYLALALLGAKANQKVVDLVRGLRVTFLYDGDAAGERACRKLRKLLPTANAWTLSVSPDDMTIEQLYELLHKLDEQGAL